MIKTVALIVKLKKKINRAVGVFVCSFFDHLPVFQFSWQGYVLKAYIPVGKIKLFQNKLEQKDLSDSGPYLNMFVCLSQMFVCVSQ